jgi:ubiquinone biosynthesis monooxygenase Coq7
VSSMARIPPSAKYVAATRVDDESTMDTPEYLSPAQRETLTSTIRVDQAGEVAANWIYRGQMAILGKDAVAGPVIQASNSLPGARARSNSSVQEMWDQEKKHLEVMNRLQVQHHVRPTLLTPVAQIAGFGLGVMTALMGKEAAMACTEAVETTIGEHYDESVLFLFIVGRY